MRMLVDGSNLLHKQYYAKPSAEAAAEGFRVWLDVLHRAYGGSSLAIALDHPDGCSWRRELNPNYKANRSEKPSELTQLLDRAQELSRDYATYQVPGFEADDILATLARRSENNGDRVVIVSSDKDLLQCLNSGRVTILQRFKTYRGRLESPDWISYSEFFERFGVTPAQWPEYRALVGDSSDGMPGVPGIGPETGKSILSVFASVEDFVDAVKRFQPLPGISESAARKVVRCFDSGDFERWRRIHRLERNVPLQASAV